MKYLVASIAFFLLSLAANIYLANPQSYFGANFETSNLWLASNNQYVANVSTSEVFSKMIELYDFYSDGVRFAKLQFADNNNDYQSIDILESIIGESIYSVKTENGQKQVRLLNRAESIKAISEWRTEYTFYVNRDPISNSYKVISLYINEPI